MTLNILSREIKNCNFIDDGYTLKVLSYFTRKYNYILSSHMQLTPQQSQARQWFESLRDRICQTFEQIEHEFINTDQPAGTFQFTPWSHSESGGGTMGLMRGRVFEKVGVNISTIKGTFDKELQQQIPGASEDPHFFATGISLVAHMCSPLVPAVHMNTRYICTTTSWFGGGADLTPMIENTQDSKDFHHAFQTTCDRFNPDYYPKFKTWCDEYFYLHHRKEPRGIGGIFYDQLNTNNFENDFAFTKAVGECFIDIYPQLVRRHMHTPWTSEQRQQQLRKRGRYVEFNLLYDRGTKFGLHSGGNIEAILMSMPPEVTW